MISKQNTWWTLCHQWWTCSGMNCSCRSDCQTSMMTPVSSLRQSSSRTCLICSKLYWKNNFDAITYEEIKDRTEEDNWLAPTATFSVSQLKKYLKDKLWQTETLWPVHCVADTEWSTLTPPLDTITFDRSIPKGDTPDGRDYSWFDTGELEQQLTKDAIDTVIITWVATDYCVGQTALDAAAKWWTTYVVSDAIEGVFAETSEAMINLCTTQWIIFITTDELEKLFLQ